MLGKRDELSVWKKGYFPWRLSNVRYNIRNFFRNFKYAWQRAKYGYCDIDTWNLNDYLMTLLREQFYYLSKNHMTYPFKMTSEEWEIALIKAAEDCHFSVESNYENEYLDEYIDALEKLSSNDEVWQILNKSWKKDEENFQLAVERRKIVLDWINENFDNLWD